MNYGTGEHNVRVIVLQSLFYLYENGFGPHIEVTPQSGFMNKLWHKTEKCSFEYQCGNCKQYFNYNYDNEDEEE